MIPVTLPLYWTEDPVVSEPASAIGRYGLPSWMRAIAPVLAIAAWGCVAAGFTHLLVTTMYLTVLAATNLALPATIINRDGVRVSTKRYPFRRIIRWDDVDEVIISGPHEADEKVRLRLTDGSIVSLGPVPRSRAQAVADLAHTTLKRGITPPRAAPPPPPRYSTAAQQNQDLTRRASQLARRNRELRGALNDIRGHATHSSSDTTNKTGQG